MKKLVKLVKQESTLRGLVMLAGAAGVIAHPENAQQIVGAIFAVLGVRDVVKDENRRKDDAQDGCL